MSDLSDWQKSQDLIEKLNISADLALSFVAIVPKRKRRISGISRKATFMQIIWIIFKDLLDTFLILRWSILGDNKVVEKFCVFRHFRGFRGFNLAGMKAFYVTSCSKSHFSLLLYSTGKTQTKVHKFCPMYVTITQCLFCKGNAEKFQIL